MTSTPNSPEFRAGIADLFKNMVDDALIRYPVKGKDITLSSRTIDGTCQFLTNCIIATGVSHHRVRAKVDASRDNPNGDTTVLEASVSLDGQVVYRFTGEMFNALALAAVAPSNNDVPSKRDPVSAEAACLALEFRAALKALLEQYPQPTTPFTITEKEVTAFLDFAGPFFDVGGFTTQHACQTGPDTGRDTFVLTMFTLSIFKGRGKVYEMDISPEYVRAFLAAQVIVNTEGHHHKSSTFDRSCIQVEVKVLDEELYWGKEFAPRGSEDSAGIDLMAAVTEDTFLEPGETKLIPTGLAFFLKNPNYVGLIHPRSGLGHKHGIVLGNLTGVIDADYNGQLMVSLWNRNTTGEPFKISRGDRIAQFLIQPVVMGLFQQVNEFSTETDRGGNGFGASGLGQQVTTHRHVSKPSEVKPVNLELPEAVKDKTFGEHMNETRPRVFKKEGVFTKEGMAANTSAIMDNLQVVINAHQGADFVTEELSEEQLERVIKWAVGYIDDCGGDSTIVKVVVERIQDWDHETGKLVNRWANRILFYHNAQVVRIPYAACTFILKNYVS